MSNATWVGAEVPRIMGPCEREVRQLLGLCIDAALPPRDPIGDAYRDWIHGWTWFSSGSRNAWVWGEIPEEAFFDPWDYWSLS